MFAAADREASRAAIMIPVAGTVAGAYGTHFQTDLTIANPTSEAVLIDVFWLPRDLQGTGAAVMRLAFPRYQTVFYEDL